MLKTSQISTVKNLSQNGFGVHDICAVTGYHRNDVVDVLRDGAAEERSLLYYEGLRLLRNCPRGRDPIEHARIVKMNFAEVANC